MPPCSLASSKQTQTLIKTHGQAKTSDAEPLTHHSVSKPFIDKISVTLMLPSDVREIVSQNLEDALQTPGFFQHARYSATYKHSHLIACEGTAERVLFQFGRKGCGKSDARFEFNPHKTGSEGVFGLDYKLRFVFPNGWDDVVQIGRVSRIDIAVDVPDLTVDDFLYLPALGLSSERFRRDGHAKTLYFGKRGANQIRIYCKSDEQAAKGHPMAYSVVRVEQTLVNLKSKVCELSQLPNPLKKMVMTEHCPVRPGWETSQRWAMFQDCVHARGLTAALALLPQKRRTDYRKYLAEHQALEWWNPDEIWKHWPHAVQELL
jgi:hypothetical protein